jgi:pimeloyl-ACP methyl ester carboxylesterase
MRNRLTFIAILGVIGALVLGMLGYTASQSQDFNKLSDYYKQELDWNRCYENFDCATLKVPIDYQAMKTGTFDISVLRYNAQDPKRRIGSLIVNPGGPGASGVDYAYNAEYIFDPDLTDRYDIVGFDPRGVNRSAPISCLTDAQTDASYASDSKVDSTAEFKKAIAESKDFIAKCEANTNHLTSYSTANAARDMDLLREALGDEKLNYMGKSYGTYLGALYANLFPDKIGRVVLDGAVDPNISDLEMSKSQAVGFDLALNSFIKDCLSRKNCPLQGDEVQATTQLLTIWQSAAITPLPQDRGDGDKRLVTESLLVIGTASALYDSEEGWPELRRAIREALDGYGDTYLKLADQYSGRQPDGSYSNNEFDSGAIIDCLDFADPRSVNQIRKDAAEIAAAAPAFGPYLAYSGLLCKYFDAPAPVEVTRTKTETPIVIIGTTGDPATPYAWAQGLAKVLPNSRLLTFVGDGHTGQGRGNGCVDDAIDAFYLDGELPAQGLRCTQ